mmetsp:Transcript_8220/g.23492  ORF Transcript_8220/g.23492 Transcript_8220/m.23492 type:complete len:241 (+) Transcript_8220:596-1318(+)
MTSPTLVPANHSGSNRFICMAPSGSLGRSPSSTGSSEKRGSVPSRRRTCNAIERYSKLMPPAGSNVGATCTWSPRRIRQQRPRGSKPHFSFDAAAAFAGIAVGFQPMSNSSRRARFNSASRSKRSASWRRISPSNRSALHSPCNKAVEPLSSPAAYAICPNGNLQWTHKVIVSPSESAPSSSISGPSASSRPKSRCSCARATRSGTPGWAPSAFHKGKAVRLNPGKLCALASRASAKRLP